MKHGNKELFVKEHMLLGQPITALESLLIFGLVNPTPAMYRLRQEGWRLSRENIPLAKSLKRINEQATIIPPKDLPIREIFLSEWRLTI